MSSAENPLQFACECVSAQAGYSDPWAAVSQSKLLPDGTKEAMLNLLAREPSTIARLAKELSLSQPSVHAHINDMVMSELVRESEATKKRHPSERYYEPNFPVVRATERAMFDAVCRVVAEHVADIFQQHLPDLREAFERTGLAQRGWSFSDVVQYCYATEQRAARELLEARAVLPIRKKHRNGASWLFWAEEPRETPR